MKKADFIRFTKALEQLQTKALDKQYRKFINLVQKQALVLHKQGLLTKGNINAFIRKNALNVNFDLSVLDSFVTAQFRLPKSELYALSKIYKNPLLLAEKVHKFNIMYKKGALGEQLMGKEKALYSKIKIVFDENASFLKKLSNTYKAGMADVNLKISSDLSKEILRSANRFKRVRVDGVPLTQAEINERLHSKYANATVRTERIIRTEVHAQQQVVGQAVAIESKYKYKIWINRPDLGKGGEVRNSHEVLNNQKIKIDDYFIVNGHKAQFPSDPNLPVGERVNCRCELKFV